MLKLIAFDLDGTVADTLKDLAYAVNHALKLRELPTFDVEDYRHLVGSGVDKLMEDTMGAAYTPEEGERMKADFQSYYADHCLDFTRAYGGMPELLAKLSDDGYITAVVSNKPNRFVPKILSALYPGHRFFCEWGQRPDVPRKPDPSSLLELMELCKAEKNETLYVGDSNVDVVFAHNAGVKVCGVSWGFRGSDELRDAGADYIIDKPSELYGVLNDIQNR